MKKHLEDLSNHYGELVIINLVDHAGREAELGAQFERFVRLIHFEKLQEYVSFDFHERSKKNTTHLSELLEITKDFLEKFWYLFHNLGNAFSKFLLF